MGKTRTTRDVKLITIGNSKGIRVPNAVLETYGWSGWLVLEEREGEIFLYGKDKYKLSWEDTGRAMAAEQEDWSDLVEAVADGLD